MRGFTKAAVLLSSTFLASGSALVIPDPTSLSVDDPKSIVDYREWHYCHGCHRKLTEQQIPPKLL